MIRKKESEKPPRWAAWLLFRMSSYEDRYSLMDDLEIEYEELVSERGCLYAFLWYILQMVRAVPHVFFLTIFS